VFQESDYYLLVGLELDCQRDQVVAQLCTVLVQIRFHLCPLLVQEGLLANFSSPYNFHVSALGSERNDVLPPVVVVVEERHGSQVIVELRVCPQGTVLLVRVEHEVEFIVFTSLSKK